MAEHSVRDIAKRIGKDWYIFGAQLGYSDTQLDHLEEIYERRPQQRNHVMLSKWKHQAEMMDMDSKRMLARHLKEVGKYDLAQHLIPDTETAESDISEGTTKQLDNAIKKINFDLKDKTLSDFYTKNIRDLLNCPHCQKLYRDPKQLPCGHTLCRNCIIVLIDEEERNCPSCKDCIALNNEEDVDRCTTNIFINDLINIYTKHEIDGQSDVPCDMCDAMKSLDFCVECLKYLCKDCCVLHSKWPANKAHMLIKVNNENTPVIELRKKVPKCAKHDNDVVSFCASCQIGVCHDCRKTCPTNHKFEDLHRHCIEKRNEINKYVESSENKLLIHEKVIDAYNEREEQMKREKEVALDDIESLFAKAKILLETKVNNLRSGVEKKYTKKSMELESERNIVCEGRTKLSSRIDYLKLLAEFGSDAHIVTECNEMYGSVEVDMNPSLENVKRIEISFQKNSSVEEMVYDLNFGKLEDYYVLDEGKSDYSSSADKCDENSSGYRDDVEEVYDDKENLFIPTVPITHRRPPPIPPMDDSSIDSDVDDIGDVYDYTPADIPPPPPPRRSRNRLTMNSDHDTKNPLPLNSRTKTKKPEKTHLSSSNNSDLEEEDYEWNTVDADLQSVDPQYQKPLKPHLRSTLSHRPPLPLPIFPPKNVKMGEKMRKTERKKGIELIHEFECTVSGMAVSDEDIALISLQSRCINICHFKRKTATMVTHKCKKISAPFDGVYSKDKDDNMALFFTETETEKKGVKILYSTKRKQLKIMTFTNHTEDPKGISANDKFIFVCDISRRSILVFKKDGVMTLSVSKKYSRFDLPLYVFADRHERLIVTDPNTNSVRELSGIDDGCKLLGQCQQSDFQLEQVMVPGKCCTRKSGSILIPDINSHRIFDSFTKDGLKLSDSPVAVAILSPAEIVVATYKGKILSIKQFGDPDGTIEKTKL